VTGLPLKAQREQPKLPSLPTGSGDCQDSKEEFLGQELLAAAAAELQNKPSAAIDLPFKAQREQPQKTRCCEGTALWLVMKPRGE
jgi:hypothetical protein